MFCEVVIKRLKKYLFPCFKTSYCAAILVLFYCNNQKKYGIMNAKAMSSATKQTKGFPNMHCECLMKSDKKRWKREFVSLDNNTPMERDECYEIYYCGEEH